MRFSQIYESPHLISPLAKWEMHDWTQKTATQAEVKVFILDSLYRALPRPPFTEPETETIAARVYDYVWQRSASGDGFRVDPVNGAYIPV